MKNIIMIPLILLVAASCGPKPKDANAQKELLGEIVYSQTLEKFGKYESSPGVISMFFWPTEEEQKIIAAKVGFADLKASAASVGYQSTIMDQLYIKATAIAKDLKVLEDEEDRLKMEFDQKHLAEKTADQNKVLDSYACFVGPDATTCLREPRPEDNMSEIMIPKSCLKLKENPWKSGKFQAECKQKFNKIDNNFKKKFQEENSDLLAQITQLENIETVNGSKISESIGGVMRAVEPFADEENKYRNWIQFDQMYTQIIHESDKENVEPKISLGMKINNSLNSADNTFLTYKSYKENENDPEEDIKGVKLFMEKNTPSLKFTILEKMVVPNQDKSVAAATIRTGNTIEVVLRRSLQVFGLVYVGKIKKFNKNGQKIDDGMMKIILKQK